VRPSAKYRGEVTVDTANLQGQLVLAKPSCELPHVMTVHYIIRGALEEAVHRRHLGVDKAARAFAPFPGSAQSQTHPART
jgi:hypothetical protein